MNGNKFATGQNPEKTRRSWEGADFSWLSSKASPKNPAPSPLGTTFQEQVKSMSCNNSLFPHDNFI
jgi:hypothetical protein